MREVGGGICKSVIRSGRLSVNDLTTCAPLDQHHVAQIISLHGLHEEVGLQMKKKSKSAIVTFTTGMVKSDKNRSIFNSEGQYLPNKLSRSPLIRIPSSSYLKKHVNQ
jgi:hypothetical protein